MDLKDISLDIDKQQNGVWSEIDNETSVLVARMHNKEFNKLFAKLSAPHRQRVRRGILNEVTSEKIMNETLAKTVLLGWKGLMRDGKEVKYSVKEALALFSNDKFITFKELILEIASNEENYRDEEIQETAKKSPTSSSGD